MISIALSICLFMATPGYSINCYNTDPVEEIQTCRADRELCFTVASIEDNNPEKCVYLRGCVKDELQFPDKASLKYLVKEQNPNGLFQVCDTEKCNNEKPPCIPKNYPKIVANLTDLLKNKTKMWEDESKKDNGKTNAAGFIGLSIGFMVIIGLLVVFFIIFHRREKNKWSHMQVKDHTHPPNVEVNTEATSSKAPFIVSHHNVKDNTATKSSKDKVPLNVSHPNVKDNTAQSSSKDQES